MISEIEVALDFINHPSLNGEQFSGMIITIASIFPSDNIMAINTPG